MLNTKYQTLAKKAKVIVYQRHIDTPDIAPYKQILMNSRLVWYIHYHMRRTMRMYEELPPTI